MTAGSYLNSRRDLISKGNLRGRSPPYALSITTAFVHPNR